MTVETLRNEVGSETPTSTSMESSNLKKGEALLQNVGTVLPVYSTSTYPTLTLLKTWQQQFPCGHARWVVLGFEAKWDWRSNADLLYVCLYRWNKIISTSNFISYLTASTLRHHCKHETVNAVVGNKLQFTVTFFDNALSPVRRGNEWQDKSKTPRCLTPSGEDHTMRRVVNRPWASITTHPWWREAWCV